MASEQFATFPPLDAIPTGGLLQELRLPLRAPRHGPLRLGLGLVDLGAAEFRLGLLRPAARDQLDVLARRT